ncbi:MAG: hypothetical protein E5W59_12490 [Mesorhizobium sp.]|nr:MAG: hypothetical protein E5W59_12490 [Mesorhizobium sp.]
MTAILPNPDPTPMPTPPPLPEPKPMREPEPQRLPDEDPVPNPAYARDRDRAVHDGSYLRIIEDR